MKNFKVYKDDYKRFMVCPKFMWLMRHRHNAMVNKWAKKKITFLDKENKKKFFSNFRYKKGSPLSSELEVRMVSGIWFQEKVMTFFKKKYKVFFFDQTSIKTNNKNRTEFTRQIIEDNKYNAYHEAYFSYKDFATRCDLLIKNENQELDIYEIKGVNHIQTNARVQDFKYDLLYQYWILKKLNFKVKNIFILHFNDKYIYKEKLEVNKMYKIEENFNIDTIKNLKIEKTLLKTLEFLKINFKDMKNKILKSACNCNDDVGYCTQIVPKVHEEYNWLHLYRMRRTKKAAMYNQNQGKSIDLKNIQINNFDLSENQKRSIRVIQKKEPIIQNKQIVKEEMNKYQFPIYFYDFETAAIAIPKFKNSSPWNQIPFQYSIHVLIDASFDLIEQKKIKHFEFVTKDLKDPRLIFIKNFLKDMNQFGEGTYVAYNSSFEKTILKKLLENLTLNSQQINQINQIINKTLDIKDFFKNFNVYHPKFYGSLSIKKTLPALMPKINYKNLNIQEGGAASALYFNYIHEIISQNQWNKQVNDLKEYCKLDSLAMVAIYNKIKLLFKKK